MSIGTGSTELELRLLGAFVLLWRGHEVTVPPAGQRLLSLLALTPSMTREAAAARLWPDQPERRALGCLRSGLWRLPRPDGRPLVTVPAGRLGLAPGIQVDLHVRRSVAESLTPSASVLPEVSVGLFLGDLLPLWDEEWLLIERERHRQLRLHALERLADAWSREGRYSAAIDAGLSAVAGEPLRESAHRSVVRAHLAEGNRAEAVTAIAAYLDLLRRADLPVELSPWMTELELEASEVVVPVAPRPRRLVAR